MAKQPETEIRKLITTALRLDGWFVFYCLQGLGCYPGISDLIAIKAGRVIFIEVKTQSGRQSEVQRQFELQLKASGGEYRLCRSLDDVRDLLSRVVIQQTLQVEQGQLA